MRGIIVPTQQVNKLLLSPPKANGYSPDVSLEEAPRKTCVHFRDIYTAGRGDLMTYWPFLLGNKKTGCFGLLERVHLHSKGLE